MRSRRELPAYITDYIAHLIREWEETRSMTKLATKLRISRTQLINVRDGSRGAGNALVEAVAKQFHGGSLDALRDAARALAEGEGRPIEEPEASPASELRAAIDFARDAYPPAFLSYAETKARDLESDRTRLEWLDWIRSLHGPWSRRDGTKKKPARAPAKRRGRSA